MIENPNILIFMTDQQRGDTVLTHSRAITPVLDRFAKESIHFSQAYCPSPHCCPSRATFFSGLYPSEHGVWNNVDVGNALSRGLNEEVRLWSEDLRDAGYQLYFTGKWHVSAEETPQDRGWEAGYPWNTLMTATQRKWPRKPYTKEWELYTNYKNEDRCQDRREGEIVRPGYATYTHYGQQDNPFNDKDVTEDGIRFLQDVAQQGNPWCLYIGTLGPHDPYFVPQEFVDLYKPEDIHLPENYEDAMKDKPGLYRRIRGRFDQLTKEEHKEAIRHYLAFCSYEDHLFGKVLEALEKSGQKENTLVLYISDHGDYCAEHGLWCKGLPCFRSAYHIPAVMRWPAGIKNPGRTVGDFVSLADFAPTFLEAAGLEKGRKFTGQSLLPFLQQREPEFWRNAVFTQSNGNELYGIQRSVMTQRWKYVYNGFDFDELYDLENDPQEVTNLAYSPEYAEVIEGLSRKLWGFAYEHQDVCINPYIMVALAPYGPGVAFW